MEPSGTLAGLDILVIEDDNDTRFLPSLLCWKWMEQELYQ